MSMKSKKYLLFCSFKNRYNCLLKKRKFELYNGFADSLHQLPDAYFIGHKDSSILAFRQLFKTYLA